jgi:hypothetical protein
VFANESIGECYFTNFTGVSEFDIVRKDVSKFGEFGKLVKYIPIFANLYSHLRKYFIFFKILIKLALTKLEHKKPMHTAMVLNLL